MINLLSLLLCFECLFRVIQTQHTLFNTKQTQYCDGSSKTALVEHFFNLIFTEFHNTPPECVCIQMCADQPTYCYPNDCFKHNDRKIREDLQSVSQVQNDYTRAPIFLVNQDKEYLMDFMRKEYSNENKIVPKTEKSSIINRPDPFKDKYKPVFRYKKLPLVELRYNLRGQVENLKTDLTKTDNIHLWKTRWPSKKSNKMNEHLYSLIYDTNIPVEKSDKFFMSALPEKDVVNYPPRYTKRELKNIENAIDERKVFIIDQTNDTEQNSSFSIDNLLNDLIKNKLQISSEKVEINIEGNKENNKINREITNAPFIENLQNLQNNITNFKTNNTVFEINTDDNNKIDKDNQEVANNTFKEALENNITEVVFLNATTENLECSKYVDEYNEIIEKLAKKIDVQNNNTLEMLRRITGGIEVSQIDTSNEQEATTYNIAKN